MFKKFLSLLTILFGLSLTAQPASAISSEDISMAIYPAAQTVDLTPGKEFHGKVTIVNTGSAAFDFILSVVPYQAKGEDYDVDLSTNNMYTQLYTWISFPEESYHIEPGQTIEANFVANVPEGTPGGGQYAAILARSESGLGDGSAVQVIPQVGGVLYGRVNGPEMRPAGEVAEQTIPGFILNGPLNITETVYNTGNVDFNVTHSITITDAFTGEEIITPTTKDANGKLIGSDTLVVLPGTSRKHTLTWENTPRIGVVRVKQAIVFLEQEIITEQLVIFCPLWLILSVIGLILLLILWIVLVVRRHKRKQPQVF